MILKILEDFLNQELGDRVRVSAGHVIGAVAILCLIGSIMVIGGYIKVFDELEGVERVGNGLLVVLVALINIGLFKLAFKLSKKQ